MLERLPERARTPAMARAITSPGTILLAGAGASAAILAGAPLAAAAVVGGLVWAGRIALAVPRKTRRAEANPTMVKEPWRSLVRQAQRAEARFDQVLSTTAPGPLKDRLAEVDARVAVGVDECWRIAQRGNELSAAVADLNVDDLHAQLERAEAQASRYPERADLAGTAAAIRQQLASAERLAGVARDAEDRLRRLAAQLNEAVARAVELSLQGPDLGTLQPLGTDVDSLVGELETLRVALEETTR
ncbi:MAG: hypothetical protein ACR2KK_17625 [Acidimicrobiales bacterium]